MSVPVFLRKVKIGHWEEAEQGGFFFTWDDGNRRHWYATLEDLKNDFGYLGQHIRIGGEQ